MNEIQTNPEQNNANVVSGAKSNTKWIIIVIIVVVVLYGLQSLMSPERIMERALERATNGEVNIDVDKNGSMKFEGDNGESYDISAGEDVSLPESWPRSVPLPSDAKITYSGSMMGGAGEGGLSVMYTTKRSVSDITEYYKKELVSNGWTIQAVSSTGDGTILSATKSENENMATFIGAADGLTSVNLSVQQ